MVQAVVVEEDTDEVETHGSGVPIAAAMGTPSRSVLNTTKTSRVLRAKCHYHTIPTQPPKSELTSPLKWRMLVTTLTMSRGKI